MASFAWAMVDWTHFRYTQLSLVHARKPFYTTVSPVSNRKDWGHQSLYSSNLRIVFDNSFTGAWRVYTDFVFKQSLGDPAAFNQLMAVYIASRQLEQSHDPLYHEDESRKYHALALQSVNSRLETPGIAADDGILVAIVSFGAYYVSIAYEPYYCKFRSSLNLSICCPITNDGSFT